MNISWTSMTLCLYRRGQNTSKNLMTHPLNNFNSTQVKIIIVTGLVPRSLYILSTSLRMVNFVLRPLPEFRNNLTILVLVLNSSSIPKKFD